MLLFLPYIFTLVHIFMQPTAMLFSSSKTGHYAHILTSGLLGDVVVNQLTPPDPAVIQQWGSMIIQFLVAAVTIWATIRKALQKPEEVLKVPAGTVAAVAAPAAATVSIQPAPTTLPDAPAE
jgi:hypothetical protein